MCPQGDEQAGDGHHQKMGGRDEEQRQITFFLLNTTKVPAHACVGLVVVLSIMIKCNSCNVTPTNWPKCFPAVVTSGCLHKTTEVAWI